MTDIKRIDAEFNPSNDNTYFIGERNSKRTISKARIKSKISTNNSKPKKRLSRKEFYPVEEIFRNDADDNYG